MIKITKIIYQIITVVLIIVGAPEFESGLYHPKWYVLPLHHAPILVGDNIIQANRILK